MGELIYPISVLIPTAKTMAVDFPETQKVPDRKKGSGHSWIFAAKAGLLNKSSGSPVIMASLQYSRSLDSRMIQSAFTLLSLSTQMMSPTTS